MNTLFEGRFLRLLLSERDPGHLFVSFDHWQKGRKGFAPPNGDSIFERRGWSHLRIQTARNDWFLNPDLPTALALAASHTARFARVTTYGFSMGGYGAIRCASPLGAARAVAVSPQATPDPERTPFETRWPRARAAADTTHDDFDGLSGGGIDVVAVYDPRIAADAAQLGLLRIRVPELIALPLPFGGHPATRTIRQGGRLGVFTELLLTAPLRDRRAALAHHKTARRAAPAYDAALRAALAERQARRN